MESSQAISALPRAAAALLAGLTVFALLFPWGGGNAADPPTCLGMFGWYTVPCGGWSALAGGAVTSGVAWILLTWSGRREPPATARIGVAAFALALVVFVVLVPTSGAADRCYSLIALAVPCEGPVAAAAAATSATVVGAMLWLTGRRVT